MHPKKSKKYRLLVEIESCFLKSPKLWAFSHRVEHLFFCQVPPKKSTVAVLDFGPVGRLRRAWWRGLPVVAVAVAVAGPRWRGGDRSTLSARWWQPSGHGAAAVWSDAKRPARLSAVGFPTGHARPGCHATKRRQGLSWVGPVGASGNARGRGHRKHPGGEVRAGDGRGAVGSRSAPGFLY